MRTLKSFFYSVLITLALASGAHAGEVYLRITAYNHDLTNRTTTLQSYLPPKVRPEHIVDLDGMELSYDLQHSRYRVSKYLELRPGTARTYAVRFHDIWTVPTQYVDRLEQHIGSLQTKLPAENAAVSSAAAGALDEIKAIRERQDSNAARLVRIDKHVQAYNTNVLALEQVVAAARRLEDMAISNRLDPGWLVPYFFKPKIRANPAAAGDRKAMLRISVRNTSPNEPRVLEVRRDLPFEVSAGDVLSADGLQVMTDTEKGTCYVATNGLKLAAGETRTFEVTVRDKWNVNGERIPSMSAGLHTDLRDVAGLKRYISVEESLEQLISDLDDIIQEEAPVELSAKYVAFYRMQTKRLDAIEAMWKRIHNIDFPRGDSIGPPPPDRLL